VAEELWEELGKEGPVFRQHWPEFDPELAKEDAIEIVVQVLGKVRSHLTVPLGTADSELERLALADERIRQLTAGKTIRKVIVVPNKLVNIVAT
jgi:leucyl-tRNA synthetase